MYKKTVFLSLIVLMFSVSCYATDLKFGVIDIEHILKNSKRVSVKKDKIKEEFNELQADLKAKEEVFKKKIDEFEAQKEIFSDEVRQAKGSALKQEQETLVDTLEKYQKNIKGQEKELMQSVVEEIKEIVSKQGYSLVLEKKSGYIIYSAPELDITENITGTYDKKENK